MCALMPGGKQKSFRYIRIVKPPLLAQIAREGHSTSTALTQLTDDCLSDIEGKNIVGDVLLDFSAAFDVINHSLLL